MIFRQLALLSCAMISAIHSFKKNSTNIASSSLARSLLFISILVTCSTEVGARKGGDLFAKSVIGCWEKDKDSDVTQYICFKNNGIIDTLNFSRKYHEGLGSSGYYRATGDSIEIIGFIGQGWISRLYANICRWEYLYDKKYLVLKGDTEKCDIQGSWQKTNPETATSMK